MLVAFYDGNEEKNLPRIILREMKILINFNKKTEIEQNHVNFFFEMFFNKIYDSTYFFFREACNIKFTILHRKK